MNPVSYGSGSRFIVADRIETNVADQKYAEQHHLTTDTSTAEVVSCEYKEHLMLVLALERMFLPTFY